MKNLSEIYAQDFADFLLTLPEDFRSTLKSMWDNFVLTSSPVLIDLIEPHPEAILQLWALWTISDYIQNVTRRWPELIKELLGTQSIWQVYASHTYEEILQKFLACFFDASFTATNYDELLVKLRYFRHREMLRIAWRDLHHLAPLTETMQNLSYLAIALLKKGQEVLFRWQCQTLNIPINKDYPRRLLIIAVGKLGAQELNFSSDIDLIFVYPSEHGLPKSVEPQFFYNKLAQTLIKALHTVTVDSFVFRVDTRLRPYGTSGPLVMSEKAFANYYMEQGREWERYALIRSRIICPHPQLKQKLRSIISPFVYRRYVDYGVIDSLRHMKKLIAQEIQHQGLERDIKRGTGGIRQIEFIVQAFQLVRGGQNRHLQQRRILPTLKYLAISQTLSQEMVDQLIAAYKFLRTLEHNLQLLADQQTHILPQSELEQWRIAKAMGFHEWRELEKELLRIRRQVNYHFEQMLLEPSSHPLHHAIYKKIQPFAQSWVEDFAPEPALTLLKKFGFEEPQEVYRLLQELRQSYRYRSLSALALQRVNRLIPLVIYWTAQAYSSQRTFEFMLHIVEVILRRSAYMALLIENPAALKFLIDTSDQSVWIAELVRQYPVLLDEFAVPLKDGKVVQRFPLFYADELRQALLAVPEQNLEQQMDALRQFKYRRALRLAISEMQGSLSVSTASSNLSDLAESLLRQVHQLAWLDVQKSYGLQETALSETLAPDFAIIAYGRLGAEEMTYASDLDLVFLHGAEANNTPYTLRMAQRIIHILSTRTTQGTLYAVDTRLRPSGSAGLLVSSFPAFQEYQKHKAWLWEHQALVRARLVSGNSHHQRLFEALRRDILLIKRDLDDLKSQIVMMRDKLDQAYKPFKDFFDLKRDRGGITDIEFMVQYGVLAWAYQYPDLLKTTSSLKHLQMFADEGLLSAKAVTTLVEIYLRYRMEWHYNLLRGIVRTPQDKFKKEREEVIAIWQEVFF